MFGLTGSYSLEELNRSERIEIESGTPIVGLLWHKNMTMELCKMFNISLGWHMQSNERHSIVLFVRNSAGAPRTPIFAL